MIVKNANHAAYKLMYELELIRQAIHEEIIKCLETGKLLHELVTHQQRLQEVEQELNSYKLKVNLPTL